MRLKDILFTTFLVLTFVPACIVSVILYISGYNLSKELHILNLTESINVQVDYIAQTLENKMVSDYRFALRGLEFVAKSKANAQPIDSLFDQFRNYLSITEDSVSVCALLDETDTPLYTIGEKGSWDKIAAQLPLSLANVEQSIVEFDLGDDDYSLGILTPVYNAESAYLGCLVTVFDKSYIFKIISSYYEISDASTYICRSNGETSNARGVFSEPRDIATFKAMSEIALSNHGVINATAHNQSVLGYYRNIHNSPWYLVGAIDDKQIFSFLNSFIWVYILFIVLVFVADIILAAYFSRRVIKPINALIAVMDGYPHSLQNIDAASENDGYFETKYLRTKFLNLMKKIQLVQHNFEGVYQLYQSSTMDDTNIQIDTIAQTIDSNKESFAELMNQLSVPDGACVVERFTRCFSNADSISLMNMFEGMRDEHLSVTREIEVFTPHFGQKYFHVLVVPMYADERLYKLFIQLRDVSSFKKQELESSELAKRDHLTGLYNRGGFVQQSNEILQNGESEVAHALMFMDVNDFKLVNDNFGHSTGDDLLCAIAKELLKCCGPQAIVSRFGGDEFAVFYPLTTELEASLIQATLKKALVYTYDTGSDTFIITTSIGMSIFNSSSPISLDELLKKADAHMYEQKRASKQITDNS